MTSADKRHYPHSRTFVGYRPKVPDHYIEGGYGNLPDEAQFQGVEFEDGTVAVRWLTEFRSTSLWPNFTTFEKVHGHADYETRIDWSDEGDAQDCGCPPWGCHCGQ